MALSELMNYQHGFYGIQMPCGLFVSILFPGSATVILGLPVTLCYQHAEVYR